MGGNLKDAFLKIDGYKRRKIEGVKTGIGFGCHGYLIRNGKKWDYLHPGIIRIGQRTLKRMM